MIINIDRLFGDKTYVIDEENLIVPDIFLTDRPSRSNKLSRI